MDKRKFMAGLLAGAFIFGGATGMAAAAPGDGEDPGQEAQRPSRLTDADKEAIANDVARRYGVKAAEVREALDERKNFDDIYYGALLAKVSGKSFKEVLALKADWWEVEKKLGLTGEEIGKVYDDIMLRDLAERSSLSEVKTRRLLDANYHPRDIRIAGRLAKASGKDVQEVLDMKKINMRWRDIVAELGIDRGVLRPVTAAEAAEDEEAEPGQEETKPASE